MVECIYHTSVLHANPFHHFLITEREGEEERRSLQFVPECRCCGLLRPCVHFPHVVCDYTGVHHHPQERPRCADANVLRNRQPSVHQSRVKTDRVGHSSREGQGYYNEGPKGTAANVCCRSPLYWRGPAVAQSTPIQEQGAMTPSTHPIIYLIYYNVPPSCVHAREINVRMGHAQ